MNLTAAERLGSRLVAQHLGPEWTFALDRAVRRWGATHWAAKRITVSGPLAELNNESEFLDTVLHEIAHAHVGPDVARHGVEWRAAARNIGARPVTTYDPAGTVAPPPTWVGVCDSCGRETRARHRRGRYSCGPCGDGVFDERYLYTWKRVTP